MSIKEMYDLTGKVAIVTGAGSGIGKASALKLAEAGADVVCADLDEKNALETVKEIEALGKRGLVVKCNVTVEQ